MKQLNHSWAAQRSQDTPPTPYDFYIYNGTAQLPLGSLLVTDNPSPILTPTYTSL